MIGTGGGDGGGGGGGGGSGDRLTTPIHRFTQALVPGRRKFMTS